MKSYPSFSAWAVAQPSKFQTRIRALRRLVKRAAPKLVESVKWGNGVWMGKEYPVAFLYAAPDHLQFGFFAGADLADPKKRLEGSGRFVRHIKVRDLSDIDAAYFSRLLRAAAQLEYR